VKVYLSAIVLGLAESVRVARAVVEIAASPRSTRYYSGKPFQGTTGGPACLRRPRILRSSLPEHAEGPPQATPNRGNGAWSAGSGELR
jgi:hypothetical protein